MKTKLALLLSLLLGISITPAMAAECTSSFYCYGNTANSVVRVTPRPPPIPPPNRRVVQQRQQAQLALRNRPTTTPPRIATPPAPVPQMRIAPRPTAVPAPAPAAPVNSCQNAANRAAQIESQAVLASKRNDRQTSIRLFREAANLRQACR
ncbi:hypothetical protein [Thiothrix subterranea]|uniref:Uncharacterized protein n=1 Tax=Thiothrix subterranea TaxID=2735563 RepID=A0AA51MMX3_9GAMM|nr:hypothetical protein [Thiothrix subterranea]MDQ5769523.1 hypothetical protein [Thiothrix subterranea]WML87108.1 hypothetical protein RCG00_01830 [Thiothrix subterranea]